MMMSTAAPRQGGDDTYFKIPSYPSISSIMKSSKSSEENTVISSLQGIVEASPRLSQFFHPTQESPPQLHSSPQRLTDPEVPDPITIATPTPPPPPPKRAYTPLAIIEARERQKAEEEAAAAEARRKAEEDSLSTIPEHLRRRWAMEEKAHQIFEGLRSIKLDVNQTRSGRDTQIDDYLFGTKTRLDPDGVRRVIKPVVE